MSNTSSEPVTVEAINAALKRVDTLERAAQPWSRGDLKMFYLPVADLASGWWPCDGSAAPDGVTTPDLRGRVPVGLKAGDADFDTLGETGGAKTANLEHVHTSPSHVHTIDHDHPSVDSGPPNEFEERAVSSGNLLPADGHEHPVNIPSFAAAGAPIPDSGAAGTGNTGTALSATQSIMNPYAVVNFAYRYV